jgi:Zc3h12a-like ribonuclease protein/S1 RNA binding family protein
MARRVVVDGSNLATEGRSLPSLAQLNEAVRAFGDEHSTDDVIVVVDASFGYRIDESERKAYEQAELAGTIVSPPAGAIGRGDGFLLQIADRTGATVLSNDSFQEFHGEYSWLFADGRLIGGKPVPGVGWIFTARTPVRGARSRMSVQEAKTSKGKAKEKVAPKAKPKEKATPKEKTRPKEKARPVVDVIAEATADVIAPSRAKRRRRRDKAPADPVNEPLPFITFIANHPLGSEVEGTVDSFASHGAFVTVDGARCYVPISGLGAPSLRSAKEVLGRGETRTFVVQALDPPRRGIELALPGLAHVAGGPTDETVAAEITEARPQRSRPAKKKAAVTAKQPAAAEVMPADVTRKTAGKRTAGKKTAGKKAAAKQPAAKQPASKRTMTQKSTTKKSTTLRSTATQPAAKKSTAKRSTTKQSTTKRSAATKVAAAMAPDAGTTVATNDAAPAKTAARRRAATTGKKAAAKSTS